MSRKHKQARFGSELNVGRFSGASGSGRGFGQVMELCKMLKAREPFTIYSNHELDLDILVEVSVRYKYFDSRVEAVNWIKENVTVESAI